MPFVVLQVGREKCLVSQYPVVDKRNTGYPVAFRCFSISLYVVLPSGEIPHKVAPIHVIQLISEEEFDVVPLGGHFHHDGVATLIVRYLVTFYASQPLFVLVGMLVAVHTGEEHILCVNVIDFMADDFIAVLLVRCGFLLALVYRSAFYRYRHTIVSFRFQFDFGWR